MQDPNLKNAWGGRVYSGRERDILTGEPETDELRAFGGSRSDKFNGVLINALARRASDRALTRRRCREGSYHWWRRDWRRRYCRRRWSRRK